MTTYKPTDLVSGALLLERAPKRAGSQCVEPLCTRMGRVRTRIADHYVRGQSQIQRYAYLCSPCAKAELARWDELTGRDVVEDEALGAAA